MKFQLETDFSPSGDQPKAIKQLVDRFHKKEKAQVLLGVTGSGKTFTMANVIEQLQKPALILAHNKTLAAQLFQEFKEFFPKNAVEYFVSYYDYYQPEAYIARTDTYIEKDLSINDTIDKLRLSATRSLLERKDVIIVSSVSCIYGLGMPEHYAKMHLALHIGQTKNREDLLHQLVAMCYTRNDTELARGSFRVRGEVIDLVPSYEDNAVRIILDDEVIVQLEMIDPLTAGHLQTLDKITIYPGSHHVIPQSVKEAAIDDIRNELALRCEFLEQEGRLLEKERIFQRTTYDLEMIKEIGFCKGIENYSRHFANRPPGSPPACLLNYFPKDFLLFVDESHQTIPQIHAMYHGDYSRKRSLIEFGFRLPSAFDNRPLKFEEVYEFFHQVVYVSATPGAWEVSDANGNVVEQIIRPTGLLDPEIEIRPAKNQIDDVLEEIQREIEKSHRVLVTTLTKKLAEEVSNYMISLNIKAKYLHSDIETLERVQIIRDLRLGKFDVLVGINLLREGLDIPEVALVTILDADKQGFLRSETSLIQTCGRASRNVQGRVIMYADKMTDAMKKCLDVTQHRRVKQKAYNEKHQIIPKTIKRKISDQIGIQGISLKTVDHEFPDHKKYVSEKEIDKKIKFLEKQMYKEAKNYHFEQAALLRDEIKELKKLLVAIG